MNVRHPYKKMFFMIKWTQRLFYFHLRNCKYLFNCNICNDKDFIMNGSIITFISNNFKGIQMSHKRVKLFEYLKSYVT